MTDINENTSDGYHTFAELYNHRHYLFMAFMVSHPKKSWRSRYHADGSMYDGWFIAGMRLPAGDVTYHLPIKAWDNLNDHDITTLETAPCWDGHTSHEALMRIGDWIMSQTESCRKTSRLLADELAKN